MSRSMRSSVGDAWLGVSYFLAKFNERTCNGTVRGFLETRINDVLVKCMKILLRVCHLQVTRPVRLSSLE